MGVDGWAVLRCPSASADGLAQLDARRGIFLPTGATAVVDIAKYEQGHARDRSGCWLSVMVVVLWIV